jgi:TPR repeat protein
MRTLGIALIALLLCAQAWAGPFEDGEAAYVRGDYATALRLLRPFADQGDAIAQSVLGVMYAYGDVGVAKDYVQAHKWLDLAASRASASEKELRDKAVKNRDEVAAKMTTAQIAEAQKLARDWKPK